MWKKQATEESTRNIVAVHAANFGGEWCISTVLQLSAPLPHMHIRGPYRFIHQTIRPPPFIKNVSLLVITKPVLGRQQPSPALNTTQTCLLCPPSRFATPHHYPLPAPGGAAALLALLAELLQRLTLPPCLGTKWGNDGRRWCIVCIHGCCKA